MQPDLSASVGLPLPKRHKQAATAMATDPLVSKSEGGASEQGALFYPSPNLRRLQYPLEWNLCELTCVIPNESTAVGSRDVQRDL